MVGAVSMFSSASGVVFKKIPAGKSAYAENTSQATSGAGMAGKMNPRIGDAAGLTHARQSGWWVSAVGY